MPAMMGLALAMMFLAATNEGSARGLVSKVQDTYQATGDMTASFKQSYTDTLRGKKRVESGALWVKRDGRVRWTYTAPQRKDFIFDGKTAYFYEPDNAQVTVFERFADSPIANAMQFLWGQGELLKSFTAQACDASCGTIAAGETGLKMTPKQPIAAVEHVVLVVNDATHRVHRSKVVDPLGNITEYEFSAAQFGVHVDDSKFAFTVPPGVSLLRATAEGAASPAPPKPSK